ncbi:hypothetical protein [Cellvibrio mixtus]|uniref:hypothetical protein n=1 Tax=Cellvibrio mixtus TaxID=39650 RepID=UPI000AC19EF2|nr:hypothetical protein [Cellvibrio mixtus]
MFTSRLSRMFTIPVALTASIVAQNAFSVTYQAKPDFPVDSGEFGHTLAKHGKYIVVGSDRHTEFGRSDQFAYIGHWTANRNIDGGAIYLLTDDNSESIKKYQFLKEPAIAPTLDHATYLANPLNFGAQVDITDNWIIATLPYHYSPSTSTSQPAVVIIPKTNGQFATCPTSAYTTGIPGDTPTLRYWGNALNCKPVSGTNPNNTIIIVPLPSEFIGKLGRNVKVKISGDAFVVAAPDRLVAYHRNSSSGEWELIHTFLPESGKYISDVSLDGQNLVIGEVPSQPFISYVDDNGVIEAGDFVYAGSGKVHAFKVNSTSLTQAGVFTSDLGFGYRVAVNQNALLVSSGGFEYPSEFITLYPHLANSPLPQGKVHQYKIDPLATPGQTAWQYRGYGEFTSTPIQLSIDNSDVLAVQLFEVGKVLNSTYVPYEPNTIAQIFYGDTTQTVPFNLGSWATHDSIYQSQLDGAKPYFETTPFRAIDPLQVSNGNVVIGWRGIKGDNSSLYPLSGGVFQVNLSEL